MRKVIITEEYYDIDNPHIVDGVLVSEQKHLEPIPDKPRKESTAPEGLQISDRTRKIYER